MQVWAKQHLRTCSHLFSLSQKISWDIYWEDCYSQWHSEKIIKEISTSQTILSLWKQQIWKQKMMYSTIWIWRHWESVYNMNDNEICRFSDQNLILQWTACNIQFALHSQHYDQMTVNMIIRSLLKSSSSYCQHHHQITVKSLSASVSTDSQHHCEITVSVTIDMIIHLIINEEDFLIWLCDLKCKEIHHTVNDQNCHFWDK